MNLPLVSIITVVYNGEAFIENTVKSVINQTYPNIEYIIIDGGSNDRTLEILGKYSQHITRLVSESDRGIYDAMNKGLALASGVWVNFLNGGDYYYDQNTLESIFHGELTRVDFIYGDSINTKGEFKKYITPAKISRKKLKKYLGLCHQSVFVRRNKAPFYNMAYRYKAEYNWVIDIIYSISDDKIKYVPTPIVYYSLGGFSEKGMLQNLKEFIITTKRRFGMLQVFLNSFIYLKIFLRYIKYSIQNKIYKSR